MIFPTHAKWSSILPPSPREYPIQGLNLIRLLTQNRIADFHTTLESLPAEALHDNPFLKHPVNLERWLMEGSYSKVWSARNEAPAEEYKYFVDSLMGTIRYVYSFWRSNSVLTDQYRNEIASCEEAAYNSLPIKDACTLLFFTNRSELMSFAQQVCDHFQQPCRTDTDSIDCSETGSLTLLPSKYNSQGKGRRSLRYRRRS
jgi:26S proteasome regulatory subunit N12